MASTSTTGSTSTTTFSVTTESVTSHRGPRCVLHRVNFTPQPGRTIGLVGPNGSGKSSLLSVLSGFQQPDSGDITVDDAPLASYGRKDLARRVAVVTQHAANAADLRVEEVVKLGRIPHRTSLLPHASSEADRSAVEHALEVTCMTDARDSHWSQLSGGERQGVHIARALVQQPQLLILDEPTNHLDAKHQHEVLSLVSQQPMTSIIALHDLNLAASYCDELVVLQSGQVRAAGTPREVLTEELIRDVYEIEATVTEHPKRDGLLIIFD
ncbi:hypothetical protein CBE89_06170 [Corynebacterium striatum]|uniref:ABC transporter domain-containing protein n=1 Tax=Corynebacterium striatum TaxID=43770 RepID=A0A2Z2J376_CORST|nr:ABC transporter ATP-binding protein [Corynebacterium striatum]ART21134.1 hypothetical protein CBE89_06170 [Corynebacterium striatum]